MRIVNVWIEHPVMDLNKTFTYALKEGDNACRGAAWKPECYWLC